MKFVWRLLSHVFQKWADECASKLEELEKKDRKKRINNLLVKAKLTAKEAEELDLLLGKDNNVILLD